MRIVIYHWHKEGIILTRREVESEPQAGWKKFKSPTSRLLHETNLNKIS